MDFDDFEDDLEFNFTEYTDEELLWHANIANFVNPSNILYIPDQHFLV